MRFLLLIFLCFVHNSYAQQNQNEILRNYDSGDYNVYKVTDKKKFEKVKKTWPITITKNGDGVAEVMVKRSGILDESFAVDVPGYPAYFGFNVYRLSFLKNYVAYYEWSGKQNAKIKYIFVPVGKSFSGNWEKTNIEVATYAKAIFANQTNARADVKQEKAAMAEADRKANSLEGKQVSKIEIELTNIPQKVAHFSEAINFGVIAILKDGSKAKTPNLGGKLPWSDFKMNHIGCSNTTEMVRVEEDASKIYNDEIVLKVASVFHPSLKAQMAFSTTNDISIQVNRNGFRGSERHIATKKAVFGASQRGGNGHNIRIKVKTVKHKKEGISINKIEVFDENEGNVIARYKLTPETTLIVNVNGGAGQWGSKGSSNAFPNGDHGGAGGNGGNVTVIKDPSVSKFSLTVNNKGARGGDGGARYNLNGTNG
ncbi:MAG: hypothetical protein K0U54_00975, partial [Bacteroidetes bacterium]|nr:hypothetical protein [Bacteroidota bacterium]